MNSMLIVVKSVLVLVMLWLMVLSVTPALGQAEGDEKTIEQRREEARIERLWNLNWRTFAPYFIMHDGQFICVQGYDRNKPSSIGQSVSEYRSESVWVQTYEDERGKEQTRKLTKPEEDAFAAVALLPKVEVGQYGYIHSGQVDRIIDGSTVELKDIWLVDAEAIRTEKRELVEQLWGQVIEDIRDALRDNRRNRRGDLRDRRLIENEAIDWGFEAREAAIERQRDSRFARYTWLVKGFSTDKLKADARWPSSSSREKGLQLIVVAVEDRTVTAVPAATLREGITELQFIDYLQSRDMNKAAFIDLVNEAKREARNEYVGYVLARLTGQALPAGGDDVNNEVELAQ